LANTILVIAEQREGKLNRVSFETIKAAQDISAATGWPVEASVFGSGVGEIAKEIATKDLHKVYALESPQLVRYTPDAVAFALKQFISDRKPQLVVMPHTLPLNSPLPLAAR
jgi:electron transfer flavoprotein alpha subunit